jgi:hypothetical protein
MFSNIDRKKLLDAYIAAGTRASRRAEEKLRDKESNWTNAAALGAGVGTLFSPGPGTAIGGALGAGLGLLQGTRANDGNFGEALTRGFQMPDAGIIGSAAGMAAQGIAQNRADARTARMASALEASQPVPDTTQEDPASQRYWNRNPGDYSGWM